MNKKAFTLVEILAVVSILGIIALIIIPATDKVIKDAKEKVYNKQKQSLLVILEDWTIDHKDKFNDTDTILITLGELKEEGYADFELKNPLSDKCISNDLQLSVVKKKNKFNYSIVGDQLIDGLDSDCMITEE